MPPRRLFPLWVAIFSSFSMIGLALDIFSRGRQPTTLLVLNVVASGLIATGWAIASLPPQGFSTRRRPVAFAALIVIHITYLLVIPNVFRYLPAAPPGRLTIDAIGTIVAVTVSYVCFLQFITVTASRYLRAQAEIALARDIHRVLVPQIDRRIGDFEFLGWSRASGDVGGDLVDLVERDGRWLGYVADV